MMSVQCLSFCLLSVLTNYLYIASLKVLDCTVVTALFATNASFVYLLSWVILHHQFVGIRVRSMTMRSMFQILLFVIDCGRHPLHHGHLHPGLHGQDQPQGDSPLCHPGICFRFYRIEINIMFDFCV